MYISKLEINNIKCFDKVIMDFRSTKDVFSGGLILGDNGLGKTTILRSIAMSFCGKTSISGLVDELEGEWLRSGELQGAIQLEVKPDNKNERPFLIKTLFERSSLNANTDITQEIEPEEREVQWDKFFVCGYGACRGVFGVETYSKYSVTDSVYSLFSYDAILQNPELIIRRIKDKSGSNSDKTLKKILNWIDKILMLPEGATTLEPGGLTVSGPWGTSMPVGALADGHQATILWVADLLGWALLYDDTIFQKEVSGEKLSGIVLIDEIEQHLHPKWQRSIVPLLKTIFPKLQFIISTHSPLVTANTGKILADDPESKLFYLSQEGKTVRLSEVEENLSELNAAQVLSSEAFGHIFNINPRIERALREASILAAKDKRTEEEDVRFKQIKDRLKEIMFPKGRTLIERIVEKEYYAELEKQVEDFNKILDEGKK